jgi:phosphate/sulfate permease
VFTPLQAIALNAIPNLLSALAGGWRIIKTVGHKMVKLQPIQGFAAETTVALIIHGASTFGAPVSTTHIISTSILGPGAIKRLNAVKRGGVQRILWAWVLTLPVTAILRRCPRAPQHAARTLRSAP